MNIHIKFSILNWLLTAYGVLAEKPAGITIIGLIENERLLSTEARIARCIGMLFNAHLQPGVEARMQLSQEEIGYLSGVSRQRANQALSVLVDAKLVRLEYGGITVLNVEGLRNYGG